MRRAARTFWTCLNEKHETNKKKCSHGGENNRREDEINLLICIHLFFKYVITAIIRVSNITRPFYFKINENKRRQIANVSGINSRRSRLKIFVNGNRHFEHLNTPMYVGRVVFLV